MQDNLHLNIFSLLKKAAFSLYLSAILYKVQSIRVKVCAQYCRYNVCNSTYVADRGLGTEEEP